MAAALPIAALALALAPCAPRAAAAAAVGACPAAAAEGACLEDAVGLVQLSQVVGPAPRSSTPAEGPGWYDGGLGQSCTAGCGDVGLSCSDEAMFNHLGEVDSSDEVNALIVAAGGEWSGGVECTGEDNLNAPTWKEDPQSCTYRDPSSTLDQISCDKEPPSARHRLCYCVTTTTTPSATTAPPATTAPVSPPAVTGDPHVTNVEGKRFNLVREGMHELLRLPRRSALEPGGGALLEVVGSVETQRRCAEPFVRQLELSGLWLQQSGPLVLRAGGLGKDSEAAIMLRVNGSRVSKDEFTRDSRLQGWLQVSEPRAKRSERHVAKLRRDKFLSVRMRLPGVTLTVDWVHREVPGSSLNHLDLNVAGLSKLVEAGGILGHDDHALAASPSPGCGPTQSLLGFGSAPASLLKASYEHQ